VIKLQDALPTNWLPFPADAIDLSPFKAFKVDLGPTQPPIPWVPHSSGVTRQNLDANHSLLSRAEVENEWNNNPTPLYVFLTCTGITLTFILYK
jgi:hypothetical protein